MSAPLITVTDLAHALADEATVVIDCRFDVARPAWGPAAYAAAHLPGAHYANLDTDLAAPPVPTSGRHPLPDPTTFAAWLGAHGVADDITVIAYDQGPGAFAARLWWMLRALGHPRVRVLDGGFAAWTAAGHPVTAALPTATPRTFAPRPFANAVTTDDIVRGVPLLVDARAADRYAGQNETIDPVAGHVPAAINRPFGHNLASDGTFLPPAAPRAQWQALLGDRPAADLVAMCGSGVTACHHLLALETAGLPGARLYAGSFSEWIRDPARPVATGLPS